MWTWYATLPQELALTRMVLVKNLLRFPVYAALIAVHIPVGRYIWSLVAALPSRFLRLAAISSLAGITLGYVVIFIVVFDYSRWVSNWAVCMFLYMLALKLISPENPSEEAPLRPRDKTNRVLGWIATAIRGVRDHHSVLTGNFPRFSPAKGGRRAGKSGLFSLCSDHPS